MPRYRSPASTVIPTSWRGEAGLGRLASRLPPRAGAAACVQSPGNCRNRCDGRPAEGTPSDSLRDRHLADLGCGVDPGLLHADGSLKTSSAYCPARAAVSRCVLCASPGRIGAETRARARRTTQSGSGPALSGRGASALWPHAIPSALQSSRSGQSYSQRRCLLQSLIRGRSSRSPRSRGTERVEHLPDRRTGWRRPGRRRDLAPRHNRRRKHTHLART
jgi:hypothetical protein